VTRVFLSLYLVNEWTHYTEREYGLMIYLHYGSVRIVVLY